MDTDKLNGLRILNTRPQFADAQARFSKLIQQHGGTCIELPLQTIESKPFQIHVLSLVHSAIFVSIPAVYHFFAQLKKQGIIWPKTIKAIAIGIATAKALKAHGIEVFGQSLEGNSEDLIQQSFFKDLKNKEVLWIKGGDGRRIIGEHLKGIHAMVHELEVYQSINIPYHLKEISALWEQDLVDIILCTSIKAMIHLFDLLNEPGKKWLETKTLLVFSERIAKEAKKYTKAKMIVTPHHLIIEHLTKG